MIELLLQDDAPCARYVLIKAERGGFGVAS
jgi:hypothetical protein